MALASENRGTAPDRPRTGRRILTAGITLAFSLTWIAAPGVSYADPPPWAPAHGYYKKGKGHSKGKHKGRQEAERYDDYVPPFDLNIGTCNRELLGSVLGGAAGGAVGTQIGSGSGTTVAIIGGTVIGYLIGGAIGRHMDQIDQNCVGQSLEHAPDGRTIAWDNPGDGGRYQVTPTRTYQASGGAYCREYTTTSKIGGKTQALYGTACRQPDGSWKLMN